ncbi:MAG: lysophospholipid acyltransferase family protein [Acidobacteriota bacterium]|nr:MAG: lysophospholipid acyltransferase family protein [Acidobacteriota bacterium]
MNGSPAEQGFVGRIEQGAITAVAVGLRALPVRARIRAGHAVGTLAFLLDRRRRRLAVDNLRWAMSIDERGARAIARGSFHHFGRVLVECLSMTSYACPRADRLFHVTGFDNLRAAQRLGRGVLVFSAHIGNWELVALRQALAGYPMDFIARPMKSSALDHALQRWRESAGNRVLGRQGVLRSALRSLREGRSLAILIDQHVSGPPRLILPFFGRPAAVTATLGWLAVRLDAPVVPVVSYARADGGYDIEYLPALAVPALASPQEQSIELTRRANELIESWIRHMPETWLWLHDRWKVPEDTPMETQ